MRVVGKKIGREPNLLTGLSRPVSNRRDKGIRHKREGLARLCHSPFRHRHVLVAAEPCGAGARLTGSPLGHDGPSCRHGNQQRIGTERFLNIGIPRAFAADIDALQPDMSGSLAGRHKSKMARIPRRIVDHAMVVHIQRHQPGGHDLRGNGDLLRRLRRGAMFKFKRHIVNQGFCPSRFLHESNAVNLERGGEGETNRSLLLRHLNGQPVLCDERMLLGDELYEQIMVPNDGVRQDWVGCTGNIQHSMDEEHGEKEAGKRDDASSDRHRKSFNIRDRRAQAGWTSVIFPSRWASRGLLGAPEPRLHQDALRRDCQ